MKNPWMSMWLSAMNSASGPVRGYWYAEMQRQQQAWMHEMMKAWDVFGLYGLSSDTTRKRSRKSSRN